MESREYSMYSLRQKLKVLAKGYSKGKPEATSKAGPKAKKPRGCRPLGFLFFSLVEDVAKGLNLENPKGGLNILPREYLGYSRDLPRAPFIMIPPRLSHRFSFFLPKTPVN